MKFSHTWFDDNLARALADDALRTATRSTASAKIAARAAAVAAVPQFEAIRDRAVAIKDDVLANLDRYLDEFTAYVRRVGGHVHFAATADDANAHVARIARESGAKLCVKSKSMTTEETHLNAALEQAGVPAVETDLGEFIVQLDHDRPSHIVTPIIHKTRKDVAAAMHRELGMPYSEDPETLTRYARAHLRDIFRRCDLGVTGVNFAVASTGSICLCTNEGNGRMTLTRPRVHVALMGLEKLVPTLDDLAVFLKLLTRSSTGQPITVYTSLVTGPRRAEDPDGPDQFHVVILDNGRRRILGGEYREVLRCIRCGACLNACPVFRNVGGHAYGSVYPGPIGAVLAPLLDNGRRYNDLPQASSLCGLCRDVCPVRIDIPDLLVRLRRDQVRSRAVPWRRTLAFKAMFAALSSPRWLHLAQRAGRIATSPGAVGEWNGKLFGPAAALTHERDTPRPAARSFRDLWKGEQHRAVPIAPAGALRRRDDPLPASRGASASGRCEGEPARLVAPDADLVARFTEQAQKLGLRIVPSHSTDAAATISRLVAESVPTGAARRPRVVVDPQLDAASPAAELGAAICRALGDAAELVPPDDGDDAVFAADVGVTSVSAAIAETGSLVVASGPRSWRSLSLISPVHIAVLFTSQVLPDLLDLAARYRHAALPANLTLISGPSKTADIEGILITGVHGPGIVHVVLIDDRP